VVKPSLIVAPEERDGSFRIVYRFGLEPLAQAVKPWPVGA
jgi:hypothetical protein